MDRNPEPRFSIAELEEAVGVPRRTIRYYINEGIVPPAIGQGRSASYDRTHVEALTLAKELRDRNLSISEIRQIMTADQTPQPPQEPGDNWLRFELHPDLEIHLRADAPVHVRRLYHRLIDAGQVWLGDDEG